MDQEPMPSHPSEIAARPEPTVITTDGITDIASSEEVLPFRYTVTSYGADFLVDGLVSRMRSGDIKVPSFDPETDSVSGIEGFQRSFVWTKVQADGFIESLLLGLPVPGIFLVSEPDGVLLVLDGQQRLRTLLAFYEGIFRGREYKLTSVQDQFVDLSYRTLDDEDRRRLDNSIIHATIVRQDEPSDDQGAIYLIFERLNTGGTQLQPQEIRVALYRGALLRLLRDLNADPNWRSLIGPPSPRLKDQELVLRCLALLRDGADYRRPMVGFLNGFMGRNRDPSPEELATLDSAFRGAASAIRSGIGDHAFRPTVSVNAAVVDSITVGVARRLQAGPIQEPSSLAPLYGSLLANPAYRDAIERSTADDETVRARLNLATGAFSAAQ